MAIINSICIKQCNCNTITITDTSDWDILIPVSDIVSTSIILYDSEGEEIDSFSSDNYTDSNEFTALTTFPDGEYRVLVTYIDDEDEEYIIEEFIYNICNIKCKKEKLIKDLALEADCTTCNADKLKVALEATVLFEALCAAAICKNSSEADKLLAWLEDKLINYKCKSC